jgi:antitoxin component YwqK of YwqJK toxin-antitoxin module/Tfp pilus assembly protein PilF
MKKLVLVAVGFLISTLNFAQQKFTPAKEYLSKGIEAHDKEDYRTAIDNYLKIKDGDTAYFLATYELGLSYVHFDKPDSAIYYLKQGIKRKSEYQKDMYILLGQAYDSNKDYENAIKTFDMAVQLYPNNYKIFFERGICYYIQKKYDLAIADFQRAIQLNPYYPSAHMRMAEVLLKNDQLVPGTLSTMHFLLLEPGTERAQNALIRLENYLNGEITVSKDSITYKTNTENAFGTLDEMLRSKVALNEAYKTKVKLPYTILIKQIQLLCEKLKVNKSNTDFWSTYYVPLYKGIWDNGHFESYMYYIFQSLNDKKVVKMNKKNAAKIQLMINYSVKILKERAENQTLTINGKSEKYKVWFNGDGAIEACGIFDEKKQINLGKWLFFYANDIIKTEGTFDNNGKRTGEWREYYTDGVIKSNVTYKDGLAQGPYQIYYSNGQLKESGSYVNDKVDGKVIFYNNSGATKYISNFKADKLNGEYVEGNDAGIITEKAAFKDGKLSGPFSVTFPDGKKLVDGSYKDGEVDGSFKRYYYNGNLESEGTYTAGKQSGKYVYYFENKQIQTAGSYNEKGEKIGTWKTYHENGQLLCEENFTLGKLNGVIKYFNKEGKLFSECKFKDDELISYKYVDPISNKTLSSGESKGGKITLKKFDSNGYIASEGLLNKGKNEGAWKFYSSGGVVFRIVNYKNGEQTGDFKTFYEDGKTIKEKTNYENGMAEGLYEEFYANGKIKSRGYFQNDLKVGEWVDFYPNGKMLRRIFFHDGEVNGTVKYFDGMGNPTSEEYYKNGSFCDLELFNANGDSYQKVALTNGNGPFELIFPNGKKYLTTKFVYNAKDGEEIFYDNAGKITTKNDYKYGDNHGKSVSYWSNGKVKKELNYLFGQLEGDFLEYFENGQLEKKYYNHNNSTEGAYEVYYQSGKPKVKGTYEDDVRHGKFYYYSEDGMLRAVLNFYNGALVSYTYEDATGKLLPEIVLTNASGKVTTKYKNGTVSMDFTVVNGEYNGEYNVFFPNGKLWYRNTYSYGYSNGKEEEFYADGKLKFECFNYFNFADGKTIYYYPTGKKQKELNYSMDDLSGEVIYYDQNEKKIKVETYFNDIFEK